MPFVAISGMLAGILAIVAGIIILIWPHIISYIIAVWLIIAGVLAVIAAWPK